MKSGLDAMPLFLLDNLLNKSQITNIQFFWLKSVPKYFFLAVTKKKVCLLHQKMKLATIEINKFRFA